MSQDDTFVERVKRRRFMRLAGGAGLAGATSLSGCTSLQNSGGGDETVDAGIVVPFSGDLSDFGEPMMNAFKMAKEDINAAGGPLGRELKLHNEDTGTDSTQGVNAANKLVDTTGVDALFGAVSSGVTISIAKSVSIPKGKVQITPASSSPVISTLKDKDYVWRTRTNDRFVAKVMSRIAENNGAKKAAVIYINNDFGTALTDVFESSFSGTVTAKVGYESGKSSYQQVLSKAFNDNPDFVAFAGYPESGTTILSQWAEEGYGGNWVLHTSLLSKDVIDNVGADVMNGMYGVRTQPPKGAATESFVSDYEKTYPDAQLFSPYSWNSYDALVSWALAVHAAGTTDSADVKSQLRPVSTPPGTGVSYNGFQKGVNQLDDGSEINYSGPSGNVDYDTNGDVASDMVIVRVKNGKFKDQKVVPAGELV